MLSNNEILKKIRVALQLRDSDIIEILKLVNFEISKGALGDLFRNEDHPNFVEAGDQILRNFLNGLIIYKRGPKDGTTNPTNINKVSENKITQQRESKWEKKDKYKKEANEKKLNIIPKIEQPKSKKMLFSENHFLSKGKKNKSDESTGKPKRK